MSPVIQKNGFSREMACLYRSTRPMNKINTLLTPLQLETRFWGQINWV